VVGIEELLPRKGSKILSPTKFLAYHLPNEANMSNMISQVPIYNVLS